VVALVLGGSAAYWLATKGVSMAFIMGEEVSFGDILLDPYIYGSFGVWIVWQALAVSIIATIVATVYPAWTATKVDPAEALRKV